MGAPASQTVTQEVDPWIRSGIQGLYSQANQYLNQTPYQAYPGSTVAGFQPFQNAAASFLSQGLLGQPLGFSTPQTYGPFGYSPFQYQMPTYSPYSGGAGGDTGATGGSGGVGEPYTPDEGEGGGTNGVAWAQMEPEGEQGPYARLPGAPPLVPTEDELALDTSRPDVTSLAGFNNTYDETPTYIPTQPVDQPPLYPGSSDPSWSGAVQPTGSPTPGTYGGMYGGGVGPMSGQGEGLAAAQRARELMGYTPESVAFNPYAAQSIAERGPFGSQQVGPLSPYEASQMQTLPGYDPREIESQSGYTAAQLDPLQAYQAREVGLGGDYTAAQMDPLGQYDPSTVSAQTGAGMMDAYLNPYENAVVSQGIEDLNRARQIAGEQTYESAGRGAYGSDRSALLEAENTRNYLDQVSRFSNQMRSAGFDRAAGLAQQDAARALQASGMNQEAINAAQQFGLGQQMQTGLANQAALNRAAEFGQSQGLERALADQAAMNTASQFGLSQQMQQGLANQAALNRAAEFGGSQGLQAALANQGAYNAAQQFGLGQQMQTGLANQAALNAASQFGQSQDLTRLLANQQAADAMTRFGGTQSLEAALANQQAMNQMGQFNAQGALQAALANQSAGLSGAGMNLGAAQALSGIGSQNLQNLLSGTNALMGMGGFAQNQAQQMINADIARYDQARNDTLRRFGLLQSIIGGMPVTMNTTQTMQPNLASQLGGGLLGVLGAAGGAGGFSSLFG
jgi:hypothetical protein